MSRRNGTTTRVIDKAIQDYFNSPTTRKDFKDGKPVEVRISRLAEIKDYCLDASIKTAFTAMARLESEHDEHPSLKKGAHSVLLVEDIRSFLNDGEEDDELIDDIDSVDESIDIFGDIDELIVSDPAIETEEEEGPFVDDVDGNGDISGK